MAKTAITCTQPRCDDIVARLQLSNIDAYACPALNVERLNTPQPDGSFDALLITSAHAIIGDLPDYPVIAVGDFTARKAKQHGLNVIETGSGGIYDLDLSPYKSLLYPCATEPTYIPDNATVWPVYQTSESGEFNILDDTSAIAVFSVKSAKIINKRRNVNTMARVFCLSQTIADALTTISSDRLAVCPQPDYDGLIEMIIKEGSSMAEHGGLNNVDKIIDQFGGMRPMARKVDVAVSTIQGWKKRDHIPSDRVAEVMSAARKYDVQISGVANENTAHTPEKPQMQTAPIRPPQEQRTASNPVRPQPQSSRSNPDSVRADLAQIRREAARKSVITTLVIFAILGGLAWFLFGNEAKEVVTVAQDQQQIEQRVDDLTSQFTSFEETVADGLSALSTRVTDVAAAVGVERDSSGEIVLNNNLSVTERLTALESRLRSAGEEIDLGQLMIRFDSMQQTAQGQGEMDAALSDLKGIVTILQGRMGQLDTALAQAKQDNDALARSLENVSGRDLSAAAMLLALTQFRESVNREEPFADDLEILQGLVGEDDPALTSAINRLAPHAESGVLTPQGLSEELRTITGEIVMAKLQGEDVSVQDRVLGRLGQILSVEKDGKPLMATKEQEIIAEAQAALDAGDIQSAIATLNRLEGGAADAAAPFKQKAQASLTAQSTTEMLMQTFFEKMQQPGGIQNMMQDLPAQLQGAIGSGTVQQDPASGIIILE
jgi:hypothetical protein